MATPKKGTNKVSGLKISRSGYKFTAEWSVNGKATDHDVRVYVNKKQIDLNGSGTKGKDKDLDKKTKKYTYSIDNSNYWPLASKGAKLTSVKIAVSETLKGHTAGPFKSVEYEIKVPGKPKYSKPEMYNSMSDTFRYSWDRNSKDTEKHIFTRYYYETILMPYGKEPSSSDWKSLKQSQKISVVNPQTGTRTDNRPSYGTTTSTELIIVESEATISANKKRFFRVYAQGPAGQSDAQNSNHAFGSAPKAIIDSSELSIVDRVTGTTNGKIKFVIPKSSTPVESVEFQYAITSPSMSFQIVELPMAGTYQCRSSLTLPDGFSSWETYRTFTGTNLNTDSIVFDIPRTINNDEVLFVRFNTKHDDDTTYGNATLMNTSFSSNTYTIFPLSPPTIQSVQANPATHKITVTVTNPTTNLGNNKSFVAVYFRTNNKQAIDAPIGIIPYGSTSGTFTVPEWSEDESPSIGIQTFVANWCPATANGLPYTVDGQVTRYAISSVSMMSRGGIIWEENAVPLPPSNVTASRYKEGTALVTWDWTWNEADSAEVSWSQDINAWESTNEPNNHVVTNLYSSKRYVPDLSAGTWYFRVRLIKNVEGGSIYGTYSSIAECSMSAAPNIPTMIVDSDDNTFALDEDITVKWGFESNDGTGQAGAELAEATRETADADWSYNVLPNSNVTAATKKTFKASDYNWTEGSTHFISVRVASESGEYSEGWSNPIPINIAMMPVMTITGINESQTDALREIPIDISNDDEPSDIVNVLALTKLPLEFTVDGAGAGGITAVNIKRAEDFNLERPNESNVNGYEGETIVSTIIENGESDSVDVSIDTDDLEAPLDDTASYILNVSIIDSYGQSVTTDPPYEFSVRWEHQAILPTVLVEMDNENGIALIKPIKPSISEGFMEGDTCDIYRLSIDRPQLIGRDLEFFELNENDKYVDPYPTLGSFGGYRVVYKTKFGDYKTEDNIPAWVDYTPVGEGEEYIDPYKKFAVIINFDEGDLELPGNVSVSNSWAKDFQINKYLGGSIEGDWNLGVERTSGANVTIPQEYERESAHIVRLLADYSGICHVRLPDGSNFYADVEVKDDREEKWVPRLAKVSLDFKRVDAIEDDIMLWSKWVEAQEDEE